MVPQSLQDDCIWKKPQISVIIALILFATMKDLEARVDAENMSRQSMDGIYILIPSLILEKLRRKTRQYEQQQKLMEGLVLKSFLRFQKLFHRQLIS